MSDYKVTVLGAGLAGCEAALWLADKGVQVDLYEQKPMHFSPAHKSEGFAELICSNSLKAERLDSASGLLKEEMRRMGSQLLQAAEVARVAAGGALAVDRDTFSAEVTRETGGRDRCPDRRRAPALLRCRGAHRDGREPGLQQGVCRLPLWPRRCRLPELPLQQGRV